MTSGRGDDPAALEQAAREFHRIASEARKQAGVMGGNAKRVKPVAAGVKSVIGGSATGNDKKMVATLEKGFSELNAAAQALMDAANTATQLAHEATARALRAREEQAAEKSRRR